MTLKMNQPINIDGKIFYVINPAHRSKNNKLKSIWIISLSGEVECFKLMLLENWYDDCQGWGLCLSEKNDIRELGVNIFDELLQIAKFMDSSKNNCWHGYPADYRRKIQDRPTMDVLEKWYSEGLIKKHCISKIRAGKVCNL